MVKFSRAGNHVTTRMDGAVVGDDVSWLAESMHFAQEPAEVSEDCEFSCLNGGWSTSWFRSGDS